jgi:hypothetical protein
MVGGDNMTLETIRNIMVGGGGLVVLLMTIVQITPIKLNPWSFLSKKIGRAINGEVIDKVDQLSQDVSDLRDECGEREATLSRTHILRFGDEILHGIPHSKEHYHQILIDISMYEDYCDGHPGYVNNVAVETIKHIKKMYQKHMEEDSFL